MVAGSQAAGTQGQTRQGTVAGKQLLRVCCGGCSQRALFVLTRVPVGEPVLQFDVTEPVDRACLPENAPPVGICNKLIADYPSGIRGAAQFTGRFAGCHSRMLA